MRALLTGSLLCASLIASEKEVQPKTEWDRLKDAATIYIAAHSDGQDSDAWAKKFRSKVESRMESTKLGHDEAAQSVVLDWLNDNEKPLREKKEKSILEACRIFVWLHGKKLELPGLVREEIQKDNRMAKFREYLVSQATPVELAKKK